MNERSPTRLGLRDGDPVWMVSAYGAAVLPVRVSARVSPVNCSRRSTRVLQGGRPFHDETQQGGGPLESGDKG
jgi:anaerobic selenocysteine-containing dehydrogenase